MGSYQYDPNGNQTTRVIGADTFNLIYDAENRVAEVKKNGTTIAQFTAVYPEPVEGTPTNKSNPPN